MKRFRGDPATLKSLPPFSWFSDKDLRWAMPSVQHRTYGARQFIQRAGDPADGLYILLSGRVQLLHEDMSGRQFIARLIGPHDFFGELGLLDGGKCIASIRSTHACEALYIPRAVVVECLEQNAQAAMCMLRKVSARLEATHRKLAQFALSDVRSRLAHVLLENTPEAEPEAVVPAGSEQIAALVGCSREMVSRVIQALVRQGALRRQGRKLTILERHVLREIASPHRSAPGAGRRGV